MTSAESTAQSGKQPGPISQVLAPIRRQLTLAALLAATGAMLTLVPLAGIAEVASLLLAEPIADNRLQPAAADPVASIIAISVVCLFAGMALVLAGELLAHLADNRLTHDLRMATARHLTQVPLGWFSQHASGEVKRAMQDDIATLHSLTAHFYTSVGRAAGAIVISVIYLFVLDWRMALIALLPFPGFFLFLRHAMRSTGAGMQDFAQRLGRLNSATVEFVDGMPVLKAFAATGRAHRNYREAVDELATAFRALTRPLIKAMAHAHAMIAPATVLGVVLIAGALLCQLGWLTPLELLPFILVTPGLCAPLMLLHTLMHDLGSATAAAQRVTALLNIPQLPVATASEQAQPENSEIRFNAVGHAHTQDYQALSNISFTLRPGTVTAVVGPSGAGKSTLAQLLLRFFDPSTGQITLGGVDLRQLDSTLLYRQIGFVLQDVQLVHASVRDNIALGRPTAAQADIESAARAANIHDRILALPRGYDSVIGEDAQLSGGECQRLSVARALLLDPPILVLDEATAAADADNEVALQNALSHFARGRTLLVIAHRLDTVMHADQILVLDQGQLVEQGTHDQLLASNGRYARLWASGGYAPATEMQPC